MRLYKIPKPAKIVAVGLNYRNHAKEPCLFLKPQENQPVDYEAENI